MGKTFGKKKNAAKGVGAHHDAYSKQKHTSRLKKHTAPHLARTAIALWGDNGVFLGFSFFGERADALAFARSGGNR